MLCSVFLLLSLVCAVLATETIALFTSSNISSGENDSAAVLQLRPTEAGEHASFFLLLSSLQIILATSGLLPIRNPLPRLLFIITLTFCVTMGLYGVSFPSLLAYSTTDSLHAGFVYLNWMLSHGAWVHCLLLSFLCISTVLHLSSSSSTTTKHKNNKSALLIVFIIFLATPFVSILLAALAHGSPETLHRIAFSSSLTSAVLAFSVYFLSTFLRSKSLHPHTRSSLDAAMVSSLSSISCIFWASFYSLSSTHVNPDFIIPLSTTTLFTIPRGHLLPNPRHHPFATVLLASSLWWTLSALYSITLKGIRGSAESPMIPTHTPYQDSPVSFWNQPSTFLSLLNLFFVLVPLPSICTSFLGRSGESEDVAFIMAVFCTLSLFGGQIWSIRLLGAAGSVYGFWHCYDLSLLQQKSNALL